MTDEPWVPPFVLLAVDLVIMTLRDSRLQVLLVERGVEPYKGHLALPGGFLQHVGEDIAAAARRELAEETDLDVGSFRLEQLGVYGDPGRDPRGRVISVAYLAIAPRLPEPTAGTDAADAGWQPADRVLSGELRLAFDHQRIVADGVERARAKLEYSSLATAFCGDTFTISELQEVYEAVWGTALDPRNFYRKVQKTQGFIVPAGTRKSATGRPARLFRAGPQTILYPPMVRPTEGERRRRVSDRPIVILTALDLEYQAVRNNLVDVKLHRHPQGTRFEVGRAANGGCRVALGQVGPGNQSAAVLAERAINEFAPAALLFVGVAGALYPHIALGDVVVATRVYAYHGGTSEDDGLKSRPRAWETSHAAEQIARHIKRSGGWIRGLPDRDAVPQVHFGAIAAGEVVLNSQVSGHAQWIRQNYNDAFAIEMEGAGVAQAGHLNGALPVVVIRGISDRADGTKEITDRARWQERAVANAAAFAMALAEEIAAEDEGGRWPTAQVTARGSNMQPDKGTYRNIARDNARVGIQAGVIQGDIKLTLDQSQPMDLAGALADFRARLEHARTEGRLDEDTYAAAREELAIADKALQATTPQSKRRLTLALKRLRGLIGDVAELATALANIISLAQVLP